MHFQKRAAFVFSIVGIFFVLFLAGLWYLETMMVADDSDLNVGVISNSGDFLFDDTDTTEIDAPEPLVSMLDGTILSEEEQFVVAAMIENHPDARKQQKGLSGASIVYELPTEGGITRFMALYSYQDYDWIGPIRSARPYFVDFASEYGAAYVHAGGSPAGLNRIYERDVLNIEALYWEEILPSDDIAVDYYFVRDSNYSAPHNLFGSFSGIRKIIRDKNWDRPLPFSRFAFAERETSEALEEVGRISLNFSYETFEVEYVYDVSEDRYLRYQADALHRDEDGQIAPRNIIVQIIPYTVMDEEGRLDMETIGKGAAYLFTGGQKISGYWEKERGDMTHFYDENGEEFVLKPGQTWIEILNTESKMSMR